MKAHAHAPARVASERTPSTSPEGPRARAQPTTLDASRIPSTLRSIIEVRAPPSDVRDGILLTDSAVAANQLGKAEFLAQLRAGVLAAAEQELAGTGWTAEHCPYIEYWFNYYATRSAADVEAALRKYAPAANEVTSAVEYLAPALARVRDAVRRWRATGEIDAPAAVVPALVESMAELGPGRPLDPATRTRLESATGDDLSSTRIHDDGLGARASRAAGAQALAIGPHIAFADGAYAPGTLAGDALLAHELAHTQQQGTSVRIAAPATSAAEQNADRVTGGVLARLMGLRTPRAALLPVRGLALQRCKAGYNPEFHQRFGETRQQTWVRTFREDHPELENVGLEAGKTRDDGIITEAGIRVPQEAGHLLAPRKAYERWLGQFFAYQGFIHYAELIEAGQDRAANKLAQSLYAKTGQQIPKDSDLDLEEYTGWSRRAYQSVQNEQFALMTADLYMVGVGIAGNLRRPPSGVTTGEINVPTTAPPKDVPVEPTVVVEEPTPTAPKVEAETPPTTVSEDTPPVKATEEPQAPTAKEEAPPIKPKSPKHGYTGEWPPPEPGPRPAKGTPQELAEWRYKRYARDAYLKGKTPGEILTPEGYKPFANIGDKPHARPGRGGGPEQKSTRAGPAQQAGYQNTETTQLGSRKNPRTGETEANMVDGVKPNENGGTDYLEVDDINKNGLPNAKMRAKLKSEIEAMKPNDSLEFWDKKDPSRRIRYEAGEDPSVVDTRKAPTLPRKPRTPKT